MVDASGDRLNVYQGVSVMSDSVRRAFRTFVQAFVGALLASGVLSAASVEGVVDWSSLGKAAVSAGVAGVVAVLSYVQNSLEDRGSVPALLKHDADWSDE